MANLCMYTMHVKGSPVDVNAFVALMTDEKAPKRFCRIFTNEETGRTRNEDGTITVEMSGDCAWSVCDCMTKDTPHTYCSRLGDAATSLMEQSSEKNLDIEVYSEGSCDVGMEHYLYEHGEERDNSSFDLQIYQFEPSDWDAFDKRTPEALAEFENFKVEWDLPDEIGPDDVDPDCGDIRIGGVDIEWHI